MLQLSIVSVILLIGSVSGQMKKCYSCASTNMKSNYMTKQRGPENKLNPPMQFDDNCNTDAWILKNRATEECPGMCFKWQQLLNNSGAMSSMTVRGCYQKLYNTQNPTTPREPQHKFCTFSDRPLDCLSDASILDSQCWCDGDLCNSSPYRMPITLSMILLSLLLP